MDTLINFLSIFFSGFQSPTLGFLLGGMLVAALGSRLTIPDQVYKFIVFVLLMKIGLKGGMEIRNANLGALLLPAVMSVCIGAIIVVLGKVFLGRLPGIKLVDAIATAGLFGAVSASTFAAGMLYLDDAGIRYEAWVTALYPFMDIPALVLAIVLGRLALEKSKKEGGTASGKGRKPVSIKAIVIDSLQGSALSALMLGVILGVFTRSESVFESFYNPLFRGFLSILMIIMGIEAWQRLNELRRVATWYALYAALAPIVHGGIAFGFGMIAHYITGFSAGGVVLLAIMAASSSDISGPPTLRAGLPAANPSAFIGASTSIGTPVCIAICIPLFTELAKAVFGV